MNARHACAQLQQRVRKKGSISMSTELNKALVRRLFDEDLNERDQAVRSRAADELIAVDFVDHTNPPGLLHGLESHKQIVTILQSAFPDLSWEYEEPIAESDKVAIRVIMHGTHQGEFFGIPPTGKPVTVPGIHLLRIAHGKIAEHWGTNDDLGLMQQFGVIPAMG
jgi:predicted ester cyclase